MSLPNQCKSKTNCDLVTGIEPVNEFLFSVPSEFLRYTSFLYPIWFGFSFMTIEQKLSRKPKRKVPLIKLGAILLNKLNEPSQADLFCLTYQAQLLWPFPNGVETVLLQCRRQTRFPSREPWTNHFQFQAVKHQVDTVNKTVHQ